jgi:mRNA interferase MazF
VKRGDIVIVSAQGDYGKPRPAVIVQSDLFIPTHSSVIVCLITSDLVDAPLFRLDIPARNDTGLQLPSQIMVDKLVTIRREKITRRIGALDDAALLQLNRYLMLFLGVV